MLYLYVDNFRGFTDTLIPLKEINFFVGENSTGKTSILGLLNLLLTSNFWHSQDFNSTGHEFGGFKDIVSVSAKDKSKFSFGLYKTAAQNKNKRNQIDNCFFASCYEVDGLPSICYLSSIIRRNIISFKCEKDNLKYLIRPISEEDGEITDVKYTFSLLSGIGENENLNYQPVPERFAVPSNVMAAFFYLPMALENNKLGLSDLHISELRRSIYSFRYDLSTNFIWLAPIRTKPKRTYDGYGRKYSPDGEHTPYILRKQLLSKGKAESFKSALENFGISSGLFKEVKINQLGKDASSPFEILIVLRNQPLRINSVGYGISQVLPLIVEILNQPKGSWFAIQQPEVHLHPKAQAALGDFILKMSETEFTNFLIETHSDFTIDRFRLNFGKSKPKKIEAQVLFFERVKGNNKVSVIPIKNNGEYSEEQPKSFREFFIKEQMDLLGL